MDGLLEALPSVIASSLVAVIGAGITLFLAHKAGVTDVSERVDKENDRLVSKQKDRIGLLETEVKELKAENKEKDVVIAALTARIDELERVISNHEVNRLQGR